MTTDDATTAAAAADREMTVAQPGSRRWLTGAFLLAGAAQLITISALVGTDPPPASWAALLLATAPAPLAAAAAFAPAALAKVAVIVAAAVIIAGIIGAVLHTGLFFLPALVLLAVGGLRLWREQAQPAG